MSKLSVREYATIQNVTVQYVYKQIKLGNLEFQEIDNKKYIIVEDKINYENKFNELQLKYDLLKEKLQAKNEIIEVLKRSQSFLDKFLEDKREFKEHSTKEKKKEKKKKKKKKDK